MSLVFHSVTKSSISYKFHSFYRFLIRSNTVPFHVLQKKIMLLAGQITFKKDNIQFGLKYHSSGLPHDFITQEF